MTRIPSIHRHLLQALVLALLLGSFLIVGLTYLNATNEINELYDQSLQDLATPLATQMEALRADHDQDKIAFGTSLQTKLREEQDAVIEIWTRDHRPVYNSHRAIPFPLLNRDGFVKTEFQGGTWRSYTARTPHYIIQVSQPSRARRAFIREMSGHLLLPLLIQIPFIGVLLWLAIGKSLLPLVTLSAAIQKRSAHSLDALEVLTLPAEIRPLFDELNALLTRLRESLETQKRFTADAAHELRTPLTALQLQLDILKRTPADETRHQAIIKLQHGITRATHVAQQLLILARLEPPASVPPIPLDLAAMTYAAVESHLPLAIRKNIDMGMTQTEPCLVMGYADTLRILIDNLIDNAIRYTPSNGKVNVSLWMDEGCPVLEVQDNGKGISEEDRLRIFERFYRVMGTQTEGTGLGLSIAKNIADRHGAQLTTGPGIDGKGASFILRFHAECMEFSKIQN